MKKLEQYGILTGRGNHGEEAMYSLALIYNICTTRIAHYLKEYDLTLGKFNILVALKIHGKEEGLSQVEISKYLIVTPSDMTKLIDKLEEDGMVTRSQLEGDRRVNIVKVTDSSAQLIDGIWSEYCNQLKNLMSGLEETEQTLIASQLLKWLDALV